MTFPKPCAHCGSRIVIRYSEGEGFELKTGLTCSTCGIRTAAYAELGTAVQIWNRREKSPRTVIDGTEKGREL